jgi:alkylated DNA repair dioxygenase AlkB
MHETRLLLENDKYTSIKYFPNWLTYQEADDLLTTSIENVPWRQDFIYMMGKKIPIPRLQNWYCETGASYTYSRIKLLALEFPSWMEDLRRRVELSTSETFNAILVNYYRDGKDSNDWHSDDEKELGAYPVIASVSIGAERIFHLRHKVTKQKIKMNLPHGSLLLMGAGIQEYWQHKLSKTSLQVGPRINLTLRYMT